MAVTDTILVVDDEPDVADLIRLSFRRDIRAERYKFISALDGEEALEALERHPEVNIVLTDIKMPRMDGLTLLSRLGEMDRILRAVVVTAFGDMQNIRTAMNRGAFDFLTKPLDLEDLNITLTKALRVIERQKRSERVHELFGRYLSPEILTSLLEDADALKLGGERRRLTLLMSDLRGFSPLTETMPPEKVVEVLNIYLARMTSVISKYGGTIDEFIGDAIFVIFGAPFQQDDHALRAVACAVDMQLAMQDVNAQLRALGYPWLQMGIAVNTGEVVVGNIGSVRRAKYGVVGSPVNLVSRIESCTVGRQILISDETRREAGEAVHAERSFEVSSKGFSDPILLYDVTGVAAPYNLSLPETSAELVELPIPLACRFALLDGERLRKMLCTGEIVHLSTYGATLRTDTRLEHLSSLKLSLNHPDGSDSEVEDVYAKVTETTSSQGLTELRFTSLPHDFYAAVDRVRRTSDAADRGP